jgi:phosphoenolpyruvate synthase/pyruvate phosphate dikinase
MVRSGVLDGRVQDWVDVVGADASQVCARAVGAAHALEARRNRHERLPDWRAFTWGEMLDWVADAVASRVEDDNKASPVWRERNVVYRFDDAADAKLAEANVRGQQLEKAHAKQKAAEDNAAASQSRCAEAEREVLRARGELEELREQLDRVQAEADALNELNTRIETAKHAGDLFS